jgi:hypothetical protein
MTTCAVCQLSDGLVINIILAEPTDLPPDGTQLIETPDADGTDAQIGGTWNGTNFLRMSS